MTVKHADPVHSHLADRSTAAAPFRVANVPVGETSSGEQIYTPRALLTEGQRRLCCWAGTLGALAATVGIGKPTVCQWRTGERIPNADMRRRMLDVLGIPVEAWDQQPTGGTVAEPEPEPDREDEDDDEDDAEDEPEPEPAPPPRRRARAEAAADTEPPSAIDDYNALLAQLRKQLARPNLAARERIQITDAFSRALAHKERLERHRELVESRVIKDHPKWKELKALIMAALLDHPAAARAVEAAISRVLGTDAET